MSVDDDISKSVPHCRLISSVRRQIPLAIQKQPDGELEGTLASRMTLINNCLVYASQRDKRS